MAKKVILCADSTCDLSPELKEQSQVHIFPLHVVLEGTSYSDGVDITPDDIYTAYNERKVLPKTAAVNVAEYMDFCKPFIDDGCEVVYISLGSALSSSYNNCRMAAAELGNMYVVDSCNLSTGSGLLVLEAADRIAAGMCAEQVAAEVQALASKVQASFVLDTLEFLHKGGRCPALVAFGANLLQLKPCIEVNNADGSMGLGKKYRGSMEKVLSQYVKDKLDGNANADTKRIFITHSGISESCIRVVQETVQQYGQFDNVYVTRAGCTISTHCGPNTLGILFMNK